MMTKNPENAEFYHEEGSRVLAKIKDMIEEGRVGVSLKPWVARASANFESLKARIQDQIDARVADEKQDNAAIAEQVKESGVQQDQAQEPQAQGTEGTSTAFTHYRGNDEDDDESAPSTIFSRSQYASTISGKSYRYGILRRSLQRTPPNDTDASMS